MKKKTFNKLELNLYEETLENGFKIYVVPVPNVANSYVTLSTKYGSIEREFVPYDGNKMICVPDGIAHFLEHKMFEQKNGVDPFTFFGERGADANANTTNFKTTYLFSGTKYLEENLNYLLDYVYNPYFTDENVEKEKGIIDQEMKMYEDDPYSVLYENLVYNTFVNHPIKIKVIGNHDSVYSITKEDLYTCYNTFYQPNNMILAIAGCFDVEKTFDLIKRNKIINSNTNNNPIKVYKIKEPLKVNKKEIQLNIKNLILPKFVLSFKSETEVKNGIEKYKFSLCIDILLYILFGMSSQFRETMLERELYSLLYSSSIVIDNLFLVEFVAESKKPDDFKNEIFNHLKNATFTKEDVERVKKVKISLEVMETDKPYRVLDMVIDQLNEYGEIIYNKMDIIRNISYDDIMKVKNSINFDNYSYVVGYPKK